jgi:hypothetical protein
MDRKKKEVILNYKKVVVSLVSLNIKRTLMVTSSNHKAKNEVKID